MSADFSEAQERSNSRALVQTIPQNGPYKLGLKRVFDVVCVVMCLPFVLPLVAILALLVKRDGGPAFYTQERVGRGGRIYKIWKLRTMVVNADGSLNDYLASNPEAAAEWALTQKLKKDPRITSFGSILRKSSFDELPQVFNVLFGQMSLVGPRPMMPEQVDMYPGRAYYSERPGITGSWQVSKRNESSFADRARFDTDYLANMSFAKDVKLLLATIHVVANGTGY